MSIIHRHIILPDIKDSDTTCHKDYDVIDWMDQITVCWDHAFTENQGEIVSYYFSLGTSINGSNIYPRTNVRLRTNITLRNLSLSHGTRYYATVSAYNSVGLQTTLSSDGFVVDMDKPIAGVVFNTEKHTDTTYQSSDSTFGISWHGFIDHFSGIKSYLVAIVSDSQSSVENVSFTNVGLQTKYTFRNIALNQETSYKGVVKAVDQAGHVSDFAISSPKIIDRTAPEPFHCQTYKSVYISDTNNNMSGEVVFNLTISQNSFYLLNGFFERVSVDIMPVLSIDRHQIPLPVAINDNGSAAFEYRFLSSYSGETVFRISAIEPGVFKTDRLLYVKMFVCTSEIATKDKQKAVQLWQIGSSQLAVVLQIMDKESSLYKIEFGAGTTEGGFQLRPLKRFYGTTGVINIDTEHRNKVFATVIAENHAGLRSTFVSEPLTFDKTPPVISQIEVYITDNNPEIYGNASEFNIGAEWSVSDQESGIKYCLCGIGRLEGRNDIEHLRLSDTKESCIFRQHHL